MAQVEPMDIDNVESDFDDKENSLQNSNFLPRTPCTEKGYEELDVSELNMKLRYSITPASSPMSKSYTASCKDNRTYNFDEDSLNSTMVNNSANLTRSLNSSINKCDIVTKSPKLPLQALTTDNSSLRRSLDNDPNDITITVNGIDNIDENLSLPSTSSSAIQTPEATTPTKDITKDDGGSPIMRGLKSVLNMFRSSQSPIPPEENIDKKDETHSEEEAQIKSLEVLASTPKANTKNTDNNLSKRSSPLKDSVVFNDDLERELQWKDETTIIFKQEKIPIHKLFLQQSTSLALDKKISAKTNDMQHLNSTVEYMDVSYNESGIVDKTTDVESQISVNHVDVASGVESDGEFLDCETTYTKNEQIELKQQSSSTIPPNLENNDVIHEICNEISDQPTLSQVDMPSNIEVVQAANVSSVEVNDVNLKEQKCETELVNEFDEQVSNVPLNVKTGLENCSLDEKLLNKEMNQTSVLITADTEQELNSETNKPDISKEHSLVKNEENKTINVENQNNSTLSNSINKEITDQKHEKQSNFDASMLLNIVTDCQDNILLNENNDLNNFILVNKENGELNENQTQPFNSTGILQIYEQLSNQTVHEHANSICDFKSNTFNLEDHTEDKLVENERIVHSNKNLHDNSAGPVDNCEKNEIFDSIDQNTLEIETSLKQDEIGIIDSIKNNDNINDLENVNLQEFEKDVNLNVPSDIPLPSDDDIEKDSLMDNFVIKSDDIEEDNNFECIKNNDIKDHLESLDGITEESAITNIEISSKNLNIISSTSIIPLSNSDETKENSIATESISKSTNCDLLVNETEIIQESIPVDLPISGTNLSSLGTNEIHQCLNNIDAINKTIDNTISATDICIDSRNINHSHQEVEDKELLENKDSTLNEEYNINNLDDNVGPKENKLFDEEIVTSENNSPYVSVNDFDLNIPKYDVTLDDIESPFETKSKIATSPPISPKLSRKGYNINFDEIDDPFATKTNIRMSPTPETSPNNSNVSVNITQKKIDIKKRLQPQNRRKSQPEREKREVTKKRFNSSYNCDTRTSNCKKQISPLNQDDNKDVMGKDQTNDFNCATTMLDVDNVKSLITNAFTVENFNISNKILTQPDEPLDVEEKSFNIEPSALSFSSKNVFNLPEIDDKNFNPFATKSKICISPSPSPTFEEENILMENNKTPSDHTTEMSKQIENLTSDMEKNNEDKVISSDVSSETCSSRNTEKDFTVREVHTEDEDTVEGPFFEGDEYADVVKVADFDNETDMMHFEDLPANINHENKEDGELFIDAEAFEFLLNQNKCNVVADSGKESLFLKFDPLFAKRVSSDGVLAALNRIQKRQSTPKKTLETSKLNNVINEEKPSVSGTNVAPVVEEDNDETILVTKPMMVVNPAINSLVSPRKSVTPPRINRRSLTFTSPAMAVIDRLLSLSGNSSHLDNDTTSPRANREYNETDVALTQLRELLAEKEIHVHNLRSESKELKERLATMESQVESLEKETEERLKKVNDLNDRLAEKTKVNKSMAVVVEEYERTIASLIAEMELEKRRNAEERTRLISERDEQTAHLASMEVSFSDLHSKYEKSKQIILSMKANEDTYRKSIKEFEDNLLKMQNNYELLKQHATSKLNHANQELEKFNRSHESEVLKLNAMIKRKELHITSLEESLTQKTKANEELTAICDELINKVG
ncbi:leucine-rich repeat and coiled-coil domain-containing protein PF3D7_0703800-like [Vanessa atalanta]|uniref:leucine-rich repeat and coiled-coil domain-containing protein PF3D7_0703800-like n=1 Tax=Vanessa atalanta TaxID=42275 RepID=UPI001FCDD625|nr:leucine-rich repeat and coiled-coil domain-containing protein PF3D7_0703800-like [Vanessa atalanta]